MIPDILSTGWLIPGVVHQFDASNAIRGLRGMPRNVLLIGQVATTGTIERDTLKRVSTEAEATGFFGQGSMLLAMWKAAKRNVSPGIPLYCIALNDDPTGVKATGTVTVNMAGTATQSGQAVIYIAGQRIAVGVNVGDSTSIIASRLVTQMAKYQNLPVTATVATNVITLTANWAGETANSIDIRDGYYNDDYQALGLTFTITPIAGGAVNPDISPVITALNKFRVTQIAMPYTDSANMRILEDELNERTKIYAFDGQACTVFKGTEGQASTWLTGRNCVDVHTLCVTNDLTPTWELCALASAAIESHCAIDPAVPFTGVGLVGYLPAKRSDDFTLDQKNNLMVEGGSSINIMDDGTAELMRMVSNYITHPTGAEDTAWRNLEWKKTLSFWRWFCVTEWLIKYRGFKLAEYVTEVIPGQKIMTKELAEDVMNRCYEVFMDAALMQNGEYYKGALLVELDGKNGKVKIIDQPVLITQHFQTEITSQFIAGHI